MTIGAFNAMEFGIVHLVIGQERPRVTWMAWLPTAFAFLAFLGWIFWLFDDVAGRGLGRVRGVLLGGGQFRAEAPDLCSQLVHHLQQRGTRLTARYVHADRVGNHTARSCARFADFP